MLASPLELEASFASSFGGSWFGFCFVLLVQLGFVWFGGLVWFRFWSRFALLLVLPTNMRFCKIKT